MAELPERYHFLFTTDKAERSALGCNASSFSAFQYANGELGARWGGPYKDQAERLIADIQVVFCGTEEDILKRLRKRL